MKVNTYTVWDMSGDDIVEIHNESYEYEGDVAQAKKGGGGSSSTTTTKPWKGQEPYLKQSYKDIAGLQEQEFYPNQTYVDRNSLETGADAMRLAHATDTMPGQIQEAQSGWLGLMGSGDVGNNPWVNNMLNANSDAMSRNLTQNLLPGIRGNSIQVGQGGSTRQGIAEGLAMQGMQNSLAQSNAQTQLGAYGQGLDSIANALEFSPQMLNLGLQPANITEFVGQGIREDESRALADDMARFEHYQNEPERLVSTQANLLNGGSSWGTSTTKNPYSRSPIQDVLGIGSSIIGIGSGLGKI